MPKGESLYHRYPDYRVELLSHPGRARVVFHGEVVAESDAALLVKETRHADVVYFPRGDVRMQWLERTAHESFCPFKGEASYWSLVVGDRREENAVWSYEDPFEEVAGLRDHLAFYGDRVGLEIGQTARSNPRPPGGAMSTQRSHPLDSARRRARSVACCLALCVLTSATGCASKLPEGQLAAFEPMRPLVTEFSRPIVCVPTAVGNVAGGLAGAPLALAVFPFVWPATWFTEDDDYLFQAYGTAFWGPVLLLGGATGAPFYPFSLLADDSQCDFGTEPGPAEDEEFIGD